MQFAIAEKIYSIVISAAALVVDGQTCRGTFDESKLLIQISSAVPANERLAVLFHELRHAWVENYGMADNQESDADQSSAMMRAVLRQLEAQGGEPALMAIEPDQPASVGRGFSLVNFNLPSCGFCDASTSPGNVASDKAEFSQHLQCLIVRRGFLCMICDRVNSWYEFAHADGAPTGTQLHYPEPKVLDGADAVKWMQDHREACRVIFND